MGSSKTGRAPVRLPRVRMTIGRKLALSFAVLCALLVLVCGAALYNLRAIGLSAERLMEEHREAALAGDLLAVLQELEVRTRLAKGALAVEEVGDRTPEQLLDRAHLLVAGVVRGPGGEDPSEEEHQRAEGALGERVQTELARVQALKEGPAGTDARKKILGSVRLARDLSARLADEMDRELLECRRDMARRSAALVRMTLVSALAAIVLMAALAWILHRGIVRPLGALREGAKRVGRGDFRVAIPIVFQDEIGDLAREFNRMEERLAEAREDLERQIRERTQQFVQAARIAGLGTLAAGVAHEINNPLASIASCAEGLERRLREGTVDREEQGEYLRTISREAYRVHETTARLLALARQGPSDKEGLDVRDLLKDVGLVMRHQLENRRVALRLDLEEDLPAILGNGAEIKQVFLNLLTNAGDAGIGGGEVRVRSYRGDAAVVVEVADDGPGVPPEIADRIFQPFFTTKPEGEGTGLGLAVASRIVEDHGGKIEIGADRGAGAVFRVVLPVQEGKNST